MNRKKKHILVLVCLVAISISILVVFLIGNRNDSHSVDYQESNQKNTVEYGGKIYQYNEHLSNYLFMGIDTREQAGENQLRSENGRADAIYLLSYDRVKKTAKAIAVPRDTMVNIRAYSTDGTDMGLIEDHINMQYMYGDGKDKSCRLMMEAVSTIFYGIPIQGYCALNMDGIPEAVGAVGSVDVVVPNDSLETVDAQYKEGTKVTITEENSETFVRYRDINIAQSAISRMERQKVFVEAFVESAKIKSSQDKNFVVNIYNSMKPHMTTNMGNDIFAKLLSANYDSDYKIQDVPGEKVDGMKFDEYHIDETQLYEMVLQTFYKEVQDD